MITTMSVQGIQVEEKVLKSLKKRFRGQTSSLFNGLVFYVNGYTEPPQNELREMVVQHGGKFVFQQNSSVTHVVASQLSNTKMGKLKPNDRVVSPQWVLDSIEHGKLLPTSKYDIQQKNASSHHHFSTMAKESKGSDEIVEDEDDFLVDDDFMKEVEDSIKAYESAKGGRKIEKEKEKEKEEEQEEEESVEPTKTSKDPNFLQHYFRTSRLHHLSAWRTQFQEGLAEELARETMELSKSKSGGGGNSNRLPIIMHVDMDCFFASVGGVFRLLRLHFSKF